MATASGFAQARDTHDGTDAVMVVLTNPSVTISTGSTGFPSGAALDAGDGGFTVLSGTDALSYESTTKTATGDAPADPTSDDKYTWDYAINGGTIGSIDSNTGTYDLASMTGSTTTITFTVKTRTDGTTSVASFNLVATISLARQGGQGDVADAAQLINIFADRDAFFLNRDSAGTLTLQGSGNTAISITSDPQGIGSGNVTWSSLTPGNSFVDVVDDNGVPATTGDAQGDLQANLIVINSGNFGITNEYITYRALKSDTSGAASGNFSATWTIRRSLSPANGIDGSDSFTTVLDWTSGNPQFTNNGTDDDAVVKAKLYRGGTIIPDFGESNTLISSYAWFVTIEGSTAETRLTVANIAAQTGTDANNSRSVNSTNYDFNSLAIDGDGTALGGDGSGGVLIRCEINYTV